MLLWKNTAKVYKKILNLKQLLKNNFFGPASRKFFWRTDLPTVVNVSESFFVFINKIHRLRFLDSVLSAKENKNFKGIQADDNLAPIWINR